MLISSENRGYVYVCETQQKGMSPLELPKKFHDVLHFVLRGQSCKQYCIENHDPVSHVVLILKELRTDSGFVQSGSIPNDLDPASHQGSQQGSICI